MVFQKAFLQNKGHATVAIRRQFLRLHLKIYQLKTRQTVCMMFQIGSPIKL